LARLHAVRAAEETAAAKVKGGATNSPSWDLILGQAHIVKKADV
jgi:hypothetical protein